MILFIVQCSETPTRQYIPITIIPILSRIRSTRRLYTRYLRHRGLQRLQLPFPMIVPSHLWSPVLSSPGRKHYRPGMNMPSLGNTLLSSRVLVLSRCVSIGPTYNGDLCWKIMFLAYLDKATNVVEWESIS